MRKNGTLNYLLSDHLGSTSLVTDAAGSIINQTQYKAWGEERYSSGTKQTGYGYTGQYSYASDFGLHYYNARWYDSSLGRFAQADTIVPGGVQGYDRYAYVSNNSPMKYIDPSGHIGCDEDANGKCISFGYKDKGLFQNATQVLSGYGVILVGNWTQQQQSYILAGVRNVGNALGQQLNMDSTTAFKLVYGITPDDPFRFEMGSCDPRNGSVVALTKMVRRQVHILGVRMKLNFMRVNHSIKLEVIDPHRKLME